MTFSNQSTRIRGKWSGLAVVLTMALMLSACGGIRASAGAAQPAGSDSTADATEVEKAEMLPLDPVAESIWEDIDSAGITGDAIAPEIARRAAGIVSVLDALPTCRPEAEAGEGDEGEGEADASGTPADSRG